jgi:acyl dehydratase
VSPVGGTPDTSFGGLGYHPPMNAGAVGKVYPEVAFTLDPARVAAFRDVFDQRKGVPTTFVTAAEFTIIPDVVADPEVGIDFTRVLHGTQEYEFRRPLQEGETLTVRSRIESIRSLGANTFLTLLTELVDPDGDPVCTARSTLIERAEA